MTQCPFCFGTGEVQRRIPGAVRLAAFGTPCGGTKTVWRYLRAHDLNVGHEKAGPGGRVCGFWALPAPAEGMGRWEQLEPGNYTHAAIIVRDPLKTAETLPLFASRGWWHELKEGDHPDWQVLNALRFWVNAHRRAQRQVRALGLPVGVVRVGEQLDEDLEQLRKWLGLPEETCRAMPENAPRPGKRWERKTFGWWLKEDRGYAMQALVLLEGYEMRLEGT